MQEILLNGISLDDLVERFRSVVREEIKNDKEVYVIKKAEACRRLGISFPTLQRRLKREGMTIIKNTNIDKLQ